MGSWLIRGLAVAMIVLGLVGPSRATEEFASDGSVLEVLGVAETVLSLGECARLALSTNEDLAQQRESLAKVRAQAISARSEGLPRIELQGAVTRSRDPSFALDTSFQGSGDDGDFLTPLLQPLYDQHPGVAPPAAGAFSFIPSPEDIPAQTFWRSYADLYWELRPTRVYRAVRAAGSAIQQQESALEDLEYRTLESVVQAYHGVLLAQERAAALEREVESRRQFLEVTRRRFQLGFVAPLDTLQAAVSLANLGPELRRRRQELRRSAYGLNELLGRDPQTPLSVVVGFEIERDGVPPQLALGLAHSRADLRSEESMVSILELQRGANSANRHPYLTMEGQWGYVARDLGTLTDKGHDFWRAGVTLHIPIFDGQVSRGLVRQNEADLRRQHHRLSAARRSVRSEVLLAVEDRDIALEDLGAARLNMQSAQDAYRQMGLRYELGKADRLQVLDAQAERFTARSALIQARYDMVATTATLKRAMGVSPLMPLAEVLRRADRDTTTEEAP
jgi:outer membrane protein TolC